MSEFSKAQERAKTLLNDFRSSDRTLRGRASERLLANPHPRLPSPEDIQKKPFLVGLKHARHTVAREMGFASWPALWEALDVRSETRAVAVPETLVALLRPMPGESLRPAVLGLLATHREGAAAELVARARRDLTLDITDRLRAAYEAVAEIMKTLPSAKVAGFFRVEIDNGHKGGDYPATLDTALASFIQAPPAVLMEWLDNYSPADAELQLLVLRAYYGGEARLGDILHGRAEPVFRLNPEDEARLEYEAHLGKVLLVKRIDGWDEEKETRTIDLDPPLAVQVLPTPDDDVVRFIDGGWIDPVWHVRALQDRAETRDMKLLWVFALHSYSAKTSERGDANSDWTLGNEEDLPADLVPATELWASYIDLPVGTATAADYDENDPYPLNLAYSVVGEASDPDRAIDTALRTYGARLVDVYIPTADGGVDEVIWKAPTPARRTKRSPR